MKELIKQICILGLCASIGMQTSCKGKRISDAEYAAMSDSVIRARADSIAAAEGRGDTTGMAAKAAAANSVKHTPEDAFVLDLAKNYTREMEIIRMGAENEGDRRLQLLAKKMLGEYTKMLRSIDGYIGRKGLTFPADTLVDISYANNYNNHEWDSAWVSLIENDHTKMIAQME